MKARKLVMLMSAVICFSFTATAKKTVKKLPQLMEKQVEVNFERFNHYLKTAKPLEVEGFYTSINQEYVVAIVKNDAKEHDFIGIMVKSPNGRYAKGELRFNFVQESDSVLTGYYYDDFGNAQSVKLQIKTSNPEKDCLLSKVAYSELPNEYFVEKTTSNQSHQNQDC